MSRRRKGNGRRCEEILETGEQCKAWARRDTWYDLDGPRPRCRVHALDEAGRSEMASRMASKSAVVRRGNLAAPSLSPRLWRCVEPKDR